MRAFFAPPPYERLQDCDVTAEREAAFKAWYRYNTRRHKVAAIASYSCRSRRTVKRPAT